MQNLNLSNNTNYQPPAWKIKQFILMPSKSYKPIYNRTYKINASHGTLEKLADTVRGISHNTTVANKVADSTVANTMGDIIDINPQVDGVVNVPYGWEQTRFRFLLEVENVVNGQLFVHYYQGFSDYFDMSSGGHINPRIRFFINSIMVVHKTYNPVNGTYMVRPFSSYQLLRTSAGLYIENAERYDAELVRPKDIIKSISLKKTYVNDNVTNLTSVLRNDLVADNNRINNNPWQYISNIVNSISSSYNGLNNLSDEYRLSPKKEADIYEAAAQELSSITSQVFKDTFLNYLAKNTHRTTATDFLIKELEAMDPDLPHKTKYYEDKADSSSLDSVAYTSTADTLNPTVENLKALFMANLVPSILSQYLIGQANITISNETGVPQCMVMGLSMVEGLDVVSMLKQVENKFNQILIPKLTDHNQTLIFCNMECDLTRDLTIQLSVNNGPQAIFRFPTFTDGTYAPTITTAPQAQVIENNINYALDYCYTPMITDEIEFPITI